MKRLLVFIIALAAVMSTGVTALADENGAARGIPYWAADNTTENPRLSLQKNQLVLGNGKNAVLLPDTLLTPGAVYSYPILRVDENYSSAAPDAVKLTPVDDSVLSGAGLRARLTQGDSGALIANIEKKEGVYHLVLQVVEAYSAAVGEVEFLILPYGDNAAASGLVASSVFLRTGYNAMPDDVISSYGEGYYVLVGNSAPVILREQFERLGQLYNYGNVTIMGESGEWIVTGRMHGMNNANFTFSTAPIYDIIDIDPDNDYLFLDFPAGIRFPTSVETRILANGLAGADSGNVYAYLYRDGVLTPINSVYDHTSGEVVFNTNYLGTFVLSSGPIRSSSVSGGYAPGTSPPAEHPNPSTGAEGAEMSATIALGLYSMAAAFAVMRRRRRDNGGSGMIKRKYR